MSARIASKKTKSRKPSPVSKNGKDAALNGKVMGVPVTNVTKFYFPRLKITKGDVINYYAEMASFILPYLKNRPESLKRNPNGILDRGFYQKDAPEKIPSWITTRRFYSESADKEIDYIVCNDDRTLIYLANLGCIEFNPWHSTVNKPNHPDYLVIDIDPSEKNSFNQVIDTALVIKGLLDEAGVQAYCKTSGASGLHIYVPLAKNYDYPTAYRFAEVIAHLAQERLPSFTSVERSLSKRGNKIYIDFMQNRRGQTIAAPYSIRPVKAASVSTPLEWNELKHGLKPIDFTMKNIFSRLKKKGDIFQSVLGAGSDILKAIGKLDKAVTR